MGHRRGLVWNREAVADWVPLADDLLVFLDFVEGLRPGLWLSAFVETLLGSFLDGYIFMVIDLSAGILVRSSFWPYLPQPTILLSE